MRAGNGVCLADDWDDGGPGLQLAKYVEIQTIVQTPEDGAASIDDVGLLASLGYVLVQANRIQNEEDAVDVCILDTWRAYNLLLLAEGVFELRLEERGDDG